MPTFEPRPEPTADPAQLSTSTLPGQPAPPKRGAWSSLLAAGAFLLFKLKTGLALLKLASIGKFALTAVSMLAMVAFEAQRSGWLFGVGFVVLILLHEMGHALAIRQAGLRAGWPVFIPFFGAMIALKDAPPSRSVEARIAYGGPLAGTAASLLAAAVYFLSGSRVWLALAYTGFFLNLFNLIPISPLDGGRVAQVFSKRASLIGGLLLGGMFLVTMAPQLLLIGIMAVTQNFRRAGGASPALPPAAPSEEQSAWSLRYFSLCFFLGVCIYFSNRLLHGTEL